MYLVKIIIREMLKSVIVYSRMKTHLCIIKTGISKIHMKKSILYILTLVLLIVNNSFLAAQSWLQRYGDGLDNTSAQAMERTADGGYFFCGGSDNSSRLYLVKTDAEGRILASQKVNFGQIKA